MLRIFTFSLYILNYFMTCLFLSLLLLQAILGYEIKIFVLICGIPFSFRYFARLF